MFLSHRTNKKLRRDYTSNSNAQPILRIPSKKRNVTAPSNYRQTQNSIHQPTSKCSRPDELEGESTTRLFPPNSYSIGSTFNINTLEINCTLASTKFSIEDNSCIKMAHPTHHSITLPSSRLNFFEEKSNKSVSIFSPISFRVSRNKSVISSPHCSWPLTCSSVEIIDLTNHRRTFYCLPSLQQMLKKLTDTIYCTKYFDSNQSNSKYVNMICTTKFRQLICTYQYCKGLFEDTCNQHWITKVFQISNIIYYTAVYFSTKQNKIRYMSI